MRKPIIAGNWKMNKTPEETKAVIKELAAKIADTDTTAVICPPYVCLPAALEATKGTNVAIGAQNCHFEDSGAYTGEISPVFLKEMGVEYVIIGHSERREYFGETNETVNLRSKAALAHGLIPIICCGETLEQREAGVTQTLVCYQMQAALSGMTAKQVAGLVLAYEPIWAIGTGKTATSKDANEVIGWIRAQVTKTFGTEAGEAVRIQYGGSMKPGNVKELMAQPDIDGGLVGGASLNADDFSAILNFNK